MRGKRQPLALERFQRPTDQHKVVGERCFATIQTEKGNILEIFYKDKCLFSIFVSVTS